MVVVGVAVGQLAHRARDLGHRAASGEVGLHHISELRELVAAHGEPEAVIERANGFLVHQLGLQSCTFVWSDSPTGDADAAPPELSHNGAIPGPLRHSHGGFQLPPGGVSLPVCSQDGSTVGRFVLEPTPGRGVALADRELAVLIGDVIAPALQPLPTTALHSAPSTSLQSVPSPGDPSSTRTGTNR